MLDGRTLTELAVLTIAIERRKREERAGEALKYGADRDFVRRELARIERDYERRFSGAGVHGYLEGGTPSVDEMMDFFER